MMASVGTVHVDTVVTGQALRAIALQAAVETQTVADNAESVRDRADLFLAFLQGA